ncbi:hypothetical protein DUGA6_62990 [Duganella sp. HH105]|nr:hypothetical protein DUGA6_62990 [Duganella sp. HH105]
MAGAGRGADAVRPVQRPADPGAPAAPGRDRAYRAADGAPHRLGRLVDRHPGAGSGGAVRGVCGAAAVAAAGTADPVRGLRALAAPVAQRRSAAAAVELLAAAAGRRADPVDVADGPSASCAAKPSRRGAGLRGVGGHHGGAQHAEPAGAKHLVHDADGGVQCAAVALRGPGRHLHRHADRQPQPRGDGRADRLLRQHAGAAHAGRWWRGLPAAARPGAGEHARCVRAPGRAVRAAGGSAQAGTPCEPFAAVPGDAGAAECADGDADAAGVDAARHGRRGGAVEVRHELQYQRGGRPAVGRHRIQHRPVRPVDDGADGGALRAPAGGGRGRSAAPHPGPGHAGRGRAPPTAGGVERHRQRGRPGWHDTRAVRAARCGVAGERGAGV